MQQIILENFLLEQEKLPESNRLGQDKIDTLKIAKNLADEVYKIDKFWHFIFDDGAYQGQFDRRLHQKDLTPLNLLHVIDGINWPGFKAIIEECNEAIKKILIDNVSK